MRSAQPGGCAPAGARRRRAAAGRRHGLLSCRRRRAPRQASYCGYDEISRRTSDYDSRTPAEMMYIRWSDYAMQHASSTTPHAGRRRRRHAARCPAAGPARIMPVGNPAGGDGIGNCHKSHASSVLAGGCAGGHVKRAHERQHLRGPHQHRVHPRRYTHGTACFRPGTPDLLSSRQSICVENVQTPWENVGNGLAASKPLDGFCVLNIVPARREPERFRWILAGNIPQSGLRQKYPLFVSYRIVPTY